MPSVLDEIRSAVAVLERAAEAFEPGVYDVAGAKELVDLTTRGERFLGSIRGRAARRVEPPTMRSLVTSSTITRPGRTRSGQWAKSSSASRSSGRAA